MTLAGEAERLRVDGAARCVEAIFRLRVSHVEIRLEEGSDCANVLPVALKNVGHHLAGADGFRDDVFSEVDEFVVQAGDEGLPVEDVDTHGGLEKFLVAGVADGFEEVGRNSKGIQDGGVAGFFNELADVAFFVGEHDAEARGGLAVDGNRADGDLRTAVNVLLDHVAVVHAVELVTAEDDEIFRRMFKEVAHVLAHGIGRSLIPFRALGGLLGGEDFHEARGEVVELVGLVDVAVERGAVELGEDVDAAEAGVQAVANRDVYEAVFSTKRDGGFRTFLGERKESGAGTAAHDDGERVGFERGGVLDCHRVCKLDQSG